MCRAVQVILNPLGLRLRLSTAEGCCMEASTAQRVQPGVAVSRPLAFSRGLGGDAEIDREQIEIKPKQSFFLS